MTKNYEAVARKNALIQTTNVWIHEGDVFDVIEDINEDTGKRTYSFYSQETGLYVMSLYNIFQFGNFFSRLEKVSRYTMTYLGNLFADEIKHFNCDGTVAFCSVNFDTWENAIQFYNAYQYYDDLDLRLIDNEYDVCLYKGEWI